MKLVRRPVDTFLTENEKSAGLPLKVAGQVAIEIKGAKGTEGLEYKIVYPVSLFETAEEKLELYKNFGASNVYVALPAIVGAKMAAEGHAQRGVIAAECLDPLKFLGMMTAKGAPVRFLEVCSKKAVIS
jgi:saccharopine dehydrogenase-like NADP-dependent oxidoreductase